MFQKKTHSEPRRIGEQIPGHSVSAGSLNKLFDAYNNARPDQINLNGMTYARGYFEIVAKDHETKLCTGRQLYNEAPNDAKPVWKEVGSGEIFTNIVDEYNIAVVGEKVWCFYQTQDGLWHATNGGQKDYMGYLPCDGKPIPPWDPDKTLTPPSRVVCLFELRNDTDDEDADPLILPVLDEDGNPVRVKVYNVYAEEIPPNKYFRVQQLSTGYWVTEDPTEALAGHEEGTVNTPVEKDPTQGEEQETKNVSCKGRCLWRWETYQTREWVLQDDGCTVETTTTTTPDPTLPDGGPAENETGPRPDCPCPINGEEPEPEEPIEPEPAGCQCVPPEDCGKVHGETTYTYCVPDTDFFDEYSCEECDCSTTTTPDPFNDPDEPVEPTKECPEDGCGHIWLPGPSGFHWKRGYNNCSSYCPCPAPPFAGKAICEVQVTPCVRIIPGGGGEPTCNGSCDWWWTTIGWIFARGGCSYRGTNCGCRPPSEDGDECGRLQRTNCVIIGPGDGGGNPTGPADPCDDCYDPEPEEPQDCEGPCKFRWYQPDLPSLNPFWILEEDKCETNCPCTPPSYDGTNVNEVAWTSCSLESPTTTTTTPDPGSVGRCCYTDFANPANSFCVETTENNCDGVFQPGQTCPVGSDTTSIPTSTCVTVPPGGNENETGACCIYGEQYSVVCDNIIYEILRPICVPDVLGSACYANPNFKGFYPNATCPQIHSVCYEKKKTCDELGGLPKSDFVSGAGYGPMPGSLQDPYWNISDPSYGDDNGGLNPDIGISFINSNKVNAGAGEEILFQVSVTNNTGAAWSPCGGIGCHFNLDLPPSFIYLTSTIEPDRADALTTGSAQPPLPPKPPTGAGSTAEWDFSIADGDTFTTTITVEAPPCSSGDTESISFYVSGGHTPTTITLTAI